MNGVVYQPCTTLEMALSRAICLLFDGCSALAFLHSKRVWAFSHFGGMPNFKLSPDVADDLLLYTPSHHVGAYVLVDNGLIDGAGG